MDTIPLVRLLAVLVALASGWILGGCGTSGSVIDPVARAADVTATAPGFRIAATGGVELPAGAQAPLSISGVFDRSDRMGRFSAQTTVLGHTLRFTEVISGLTLYVHSPLFARLPRLGGKTWLKLDLGHALGSMGISGLPTGDGDPSQFLDYLRAVGARTTPIGNATVRGVPTKGYRAVIDLNRYPDLVAPARRAAVRRTIQQLTSLTGIHTMPVEVWIDAQHRVRQERFAVHECVSGVRAGFDITIDVYDYGPQPKPRLPAASQVYDATPLAAVGVRSIRGCAS